MDSEVLDTNKAAERLGVSRQRILNMIYSGRLKATRFGKTSYMITTADLEAVGERKVGKPRKQVIGAGTI